MNTVLVYSQRHTVSPHGIVPPSSRLSTLISTDNITVPLNDHLFTTYTVAMTPSLKS